MYEVGVRELKASLSAMLRLVARGERVRVTVHGRAQGHARRRWLVHVPRGYVETVRAVTWDHRLHAAALDVGLQAVPDRPP